MCQCSCLCASPVLHTANYYSKTDWKLELTQILSSVCTVAGLILVSWGSIRKSALTFLDYSPRTEKRLVNPQVGEALVLLEALVKSAEGWRDGSVSEPERGRGKHIGGRGVHSWIISLVGSNITLERFWANDFWDVISHGYDLEVKRKRVWILRRNRTKKWFMCCKYVCRIPVGLLVRRVFLIVHKISHLFHLCSLQQISSAFIAIYESLSSTPES